MRLKALSFILCALMVPLGVQAYTGNDLLERCKSANQSTRSFCLGYVIGVIDGWNNGVFVASSDVVSGARRQAGCDVPGQVTNEQLKDIALRFLERNPARRHLDAALSVVAAMREAFPCPNAR
jgi:hypothetical protein